MFGKNKSTLSYSAINLWNTSKERYRTQYYYEERRFVDTVYTKYGKLIHEKLEKDPTFMPDIDRKGLREQSIESVIAGVPVRGFIDYIDLRVPLIRDYKTGKKRWTAAQVYALDQLVLYAYMVDQEYGLTVRDADVLWIETEEKKNTLRIGGVTLEGERELQVTGNYEIIKRPYKITKKDKRSIVDWVAKAAEEISEDYALFLSRSEPQVLSL